MWAMQMIRQVLVLQRNVRTLKAYKPKKLSSKFIMQQLIAVRRKIEKPESYCQIYKTFSIIYVEDKHIYVYIYIYRLHLYPYLFLYVSIDYIFIYNTCLSQRINMGELGNVISNSSCLTYSELDFTTTKNIFFKRLIRKFTKNKYYSE